MSAEPLDLAQPTTVHVIGVGGAGMSAIALALAQMGHSVSGSDLRPSPVIDRLRRAGIDVAIGHGQGALERSDRSEQLSSGGDPDPLVLCGDSLGIGRAHRR